MLIAYKDKKLERFTIGVNVLAAACVAASFVMLFGFQKPLLPTVVLFSAQAGLLCVFVVEKIFRFINTVSKLDFWRGNWFEIPFFLGLMAAIIGATWVFEVEDPRWIRHLAIGVYLVIQVVVKLCRTSVNMAATGQNPTRTLIASFLFLILTGAGMLMLPTAANGENVSAVDALFTATSATCVTGLVVRDTGTEFSFMGQLIILVLIQLGGLGIVIFGAVFALLLGQALSVREEVAMQDILSTRTLGRIGNMIAFIFISTIILEAIGAAGMFRMWEKVPGSVSNFEEQWFYSIFHSISAFCNAGFSLFGKSFIDYSRYWEIYAIICPLIILGGLGFSVLYDLFHITTNRVERFIKSRFNRHYRFSREAPARMQLQTKIVLSVSAILIVAGVAAILLFERFAGGTGPHKNPHVLDALFQSVTARTAGFNTVDISSMSAAGKFIVILLMFIGGSPGSTAGGIKTVTLAVVIMTAFAALRKRGEVEMFKRSVRIVVVGRAITVMLLFIGVLFVSGLALCITENGNGFDMSDIMFEAASALGTVGLSTGITGSLTVPGKLIIIVVMLIGRLGPLTLLAALTFNIKPARYNYPDEAIIVG
jgi:trk system potassium uptake protein TrkH